MNNFKFETVSLMILCTFSFASFLCSFAMAVKFNDVYYLFPDGILTLGCGILAASLIAKKTEIRRLSSALFHLTLALDKILHMNQRYEDLYGKLPEEEKKEEETK